MALTRKPYAAFGYILYQNTCVANDNYIFDTATPDGMCTTLVTTGVALPINNVTGEALSLYQAGDFKRQYEYVPGSFKMNVQQDIEIFCFTPQVNNGVIVAPFTVFNLEQGVTTTLNVGTKLFLCRGTLDIDGVAVNGPTQVNVKSSSKSVTAQTQCYGFLFE